MDRFEPVLAVAPRTHNLTRLAEDGHSLQPRANHAATMEADIQALL